MKQKISVLAIFALVFVLTFVFLSLSGFSKPEKENQSNFADNKLASYDPAEVSSNESKDQSLLNPKTQAGVFVTRIIDGDTIELENGQKVRYIGIDTPETSDPRTGVQCYGKEATAKNRELVEGKKVHLEKDISETDKYGRLLRYIFVNNQMINETLVKEGFAFSSPYPPDIKYQSRFDNAEQYARENNKGLWGSCGFIAGAQDKTTLPEADCSIKGNISSSSEKIYHIPGQKYYNRTVISESKGERWFCSEEEAQSAGWRRSKL